MLRAYRWRIDPSFDARYDLYGLLRASKLREQVPKDYSATFNATFATVATMWNNDHRFRSEADLRAFLKRGRHDRGIRGDFLKETSRRIVNAATELVTFGARRWKSS